MLDSDHSGLLTSLLRYPSPSPLYPFSPHLILSQALLLRNSINPTAGVEVVIQNHEVLGVSPQPPLREPVPTRLPPRPPPRGVQGLAAGLFERAQAAGLDRAILSTVADLRVSRASHAIGVWLTRSAIYQTRPTLTSTISPFRPPPPPRRTFRDRSRRSPLYLRYHDTSLHPSSLQRQQIQSLRPRPSVMPSAS